MAYRHTQAREPSKAPLGPAREGPLGNSGALECLQTAPGGLR